jgi:hypothetical protein
MGVMDLVNLLFGGGVLAQGWAAARWVARVEMRLDKLEAKGEAHA